MYVIVHPHYPHQSKIGLSANPLRRLEAANTWAPGVRFELYGMVHFEDAPTAEKAAHRILADVATRGEWFLVSPHKALNLLRGLRRRERNRLKHDRHQ